MARLCLFQHVTASTNDSTDQSCQVSLVPRLSAASFLVAYVTFEPPSDKLAEGLVPLLHHLQARRTRL